jgi:RNA polymerase sigma factor (sigma-70 family)
MDAAALFEANLDVIDRAISCVCRRARMQGADAEDFASAARLALIENDYAILRSFAGRSSFATFVGVIVQRFFADELTKVRGRWHASREAERLGQAGIVLEQLVRRDHRSIDDALPIVRAIDPTLTREQLLEMEARLPPRTARPRQVPLDDTELHAAAPEHAESRAMAMHIDRVSSRTVHAIRDELAAMPVEDRMILRLRFGSSMAINEISVMLRLPQRPLYRRLDALLQRLRRALTAAGIEGRDVADLIGPASREMNFGLDGEGAAVWQGNRHEAGI